jgi:hypothetical protein
MPPPAKAFHANLEAPGADAGIGRSMRSATYGVLTEASQYRNMTPPPERFHVVHGDRSKGSETA